jgi:uncharacterized protein (TIGR02284 family)
MNSNTHLQNLNRLIEVCLDGDLGYRTAARHLHSSKLRTIFTDYAIRRSQFAEELRAEVEHLGGSPTDAGSAAASLHRGWIALKSAVSGGDAGAIVAACEAGEDSALASYQAAVHSIFLADLPADPPSHTRSLIEKQRQAIEEAHHRIRHIKDEIASGVEYSVND